MWALSLVATLGGLLVLLPDKDGRFVFKWCLPALIDHCGSFFVPDESCVQLIIFSLKFARLKSICPSASTRISLQSSLSDIKQALHYGKLVAMKPASTPLLPLFPSLPFSGKPTNSAFSSQLPGTSMHI